MKTLLTLTLLLAASLAEETPQGFIEATNKFSSSAYKEISKIENGNFLVSPFSAETILALTLSGSRGESAKELRTALRLLDSDEKTEEDIRGLLGDLKGSQSYTLHTANKMYIKTDFDVKPEFKKTATDVFLADTENIDFTRNVKAAQVMNAWVEGQTENKIRELISSDLLNDRTRLVLINALYLKANWSTPFRLSYTSKRSFHKTPTEQVEADFMHNAYTQRFLYFECPHLNARFLELPFKGGDASMTFILPNDKNGLSELENQIDSALVHHNVTSQFVRVALPKFKIESKIDLKEILKKLGVQAIFKDSEADLSGIAGEPGDLLVSEIIQKSFIDLNEEGVEAAAATFSIVAVPMSGVRNTGEFIADHPFIFYIKVRGVIVFVGRVTDPSN